MTQTFWVRIGATITVDLPDNHTEKDIEEAISKAIEQHNPGKLDFYFDGEAYIPASDENKIQSDIDLFF
jgi:hypothetical protein